MIFDMPPLSSTLPTSNDLVGTTGHLSAQEEEAFAQQMATWTNLGATENSATDATAAASVTAATAAEPSFQSAASTTPSMTLGNSMLPSMNSLLGMTGLSALDSLLMPPVSGDNNLLLSPTAADFQTLFANNVNGLSPLPPPAPLNTSSVLEANELTQQSLSHATMSSAFSQSMMDMFASPATTSYLGTPTVSMMDVQMQPFLTPQLGNRTLNPSRRQSMSMALPPGPRERRAHSVAGRQRRASASKASAAVKRHSIDTNAIANLLSVPETPLLGTNLSPTPAASALAMPVAPPKVEPTASVEVQKREAEEQLLELNFEDVTVVTMKTLLRQLGHSANGKKTELMERLQSEAIRVRMTQSATLTVSAPVTLEVPSLHVNGKFAPGSLSPIAPLFPGMAGNMATSNWTL